METFGLRTGQTPTGANPEFKTNNIMGKQLLIIGFDGSHHAGLAKEITDLLCQRGLSVGHSSLRYGGMTTFATGGAADLKKELEEAGLPSSGIQEGLPGGTGEVTAKEGVTLPLLKEQLDRIEVGQIGLAHGLTSLLKKEGDALAGAKAGKAAGAKKKGVEVELLQGEQTGKAPVEEDGGSKNDEKKAAEGDDAANGPSLQEQEQADTTGTTAPTEGNEG